MNKITAYMFSLGLLASVATLSSVSTPAYALQESRPIATDSRIQTARYSENEVYRFLGHYGYQSIIKFSPGEEILTVSVGDSVAWMFNPVGSRLFLKPIEPDPLTNMTVITNKREYHFEIDAEETDDIRDKKMVFVMRFTYPEEYSAGLSRANALDKVPDITDPEQRESLNFKYSMVGSGQISPLRIFDDGEFTYFEFPNKNADVPAFFLVESTGDEAIVNFRTRGDYIAVERVAAQFTLRRGADVLCIFNETRKLPPKPVPMDRRTWIGKTVDYLSF